jgi:glycosyltransferase involved in cell wall biosynthesis
VCLVFAGELADDDFGQKLKRAVEKAHLGGRLRITGFLSERDYERYLQSTDVAVQLRTKSRGGTPKGVLDCLAVGLPVIVNKDASYDDYPDNVVIKIDADASVEVIAHALVSTCADRAARKAVGREGRQYVREHHDPARCAAEYAAAISEFIGRERSTQPKHWTSSFAAHLAGCEEPLNAARVAAKWLGHIPKHQWRRHRLLIDVSHISQSDHKTGIPRVVKCTIKELYCLARTDVEAVAVELIDGVLSVATAWLTAQGLLISSETDSKTGPERIEFRPGDTLLMLDSSWARYSEFFPTFELARQAGVPVYTAVYDLLPLTLPPDNFVEGGPEWFRGWFRDAVSMSDGLVCISRAVADDVARHLDVAATKAKMPKIGFWHLGSDPNPRPSASDPSHSASSLVTQPYLLMVGTIEPRKSHKLALDAMQQLWARGHQLRLCVAGSEGWMVGELMAELRSRSGGDGELILIERPTDADVLRLYERAEGLLFISKGEGFGLPLVEAAHHGTPIICSDIPVFREIAGEYATYVSLKDASSLAADLELWWEAKLRGEVADTRKMPRLTWEQSAADLLSVVLDDNWLTE